jgi:FMN reductase
MFVVGIGGTTRAESSSALALEAALDRATALGAETRQFSGQALMLPAYDPAQPLSPEASELVEACRRADALVIASPGYHGTVSGLVKNALDHLEELREDERPYLDGRPVGCIAVAYGWQAAVNTLRTLRDVVHALRGIPTPLGVTINAALHGSSGLDDASAERLGQLAGQVTNLGRALAASPSSS